MTLHTTSYSENTFDLHLIMAFHCRSFILPIIVIERAFVIIINSFKCFWTAFDVRAEVIRCSFVLCVYFCRRRGAREIKIKVVTACATCILAQFQNCGNQTNMYSSSLLRVGRVILG